MLNGVSNISSLSLRTRKDKQRLKRENERLQRDKEQLEASTKKWKKKMESHKSKLTDAETENNKVGLDSGSLPKEGFLKDRFPKIDSQNY